MTSPVGRRALITGITGQDGSYLAELLLAKGYEVHGLIRRASTFNTHRIEHLYVDPHEEHARLFLHYGDLTDGTRLVTLLSRLQPDEVYHLAAQSHVRVSFDEPEYTGLTTGMGTTRLLEAIRAAGLSTRFYQASSSEMFGAAPPPQNEQTPFHPRSPYGAAKLYGYWIARNYRDAYGMYAVNGILFNHESPRRGETFVTRKITRAVAAIAAGRQEYLYLGNLDAVRDWGYAPEYVEAMWRMLQADRPDDYVLATGTAHTVRDFVQFAFDHAGLDWEQHVRFDERYLRPSEVDALIGDASKATEQLGWTAPGVGPRAGPDHGRRRPRGDRNEGAARTRTRLMVRDVPRGSRRLPEPLRDSLRAVAKESIWLTVQYRPGPKPPIALFSTRRGGSTWLMEIIGANRGVLPLNQPLEILTPNLTPHQYKRLPKFDLGQIVHPDSDQERELRAYTDDLMAGRIRVNAPHAFWRRDFQFRTDRLLLKIVDAKPMMDWFYATYHPDIVYLVRHPVPQAMSCIRNGWSTTTKAYLRNEWFIDEVLADRHLLTYAHTVDDTGTDLERFVLNWVVENLYPLRVLADRPHWLALSYEECVTDQDATLRRVGERLDLGDTDRMRRSCAAGVPVVESVRRRERFGDPQW